jgi:uncharacterized protein (TIRG00374 family)
MPGFLKDWKLAGILLSIALLVLAFWKVDLRQLATVMGGAKPLQLLAVVGLNFVVVAIKAYRWQLVLSSTKAVRFVTVFLTLLVGYMANNILPARAGELVRIFVLGRKESVSKTTVLGTLALDRVFDGVGMLALLVALPFMLETPDWMRKGTIGFVILMAAVFVALVILVRFESDKWVGFLPLSEKWISLLKNVFNKLRDGLSTLNSVPMIAGVLLISVVCWCLQALMVYLCLESINLHFGLNHAIFILMAINLAIMVPAAPSSIGTFEFSAVLALEYLNVPKTPALSFALIYHFAQLIPITLAGILVLPALGMGIRDLGNKEQMQDE